MEKKLKFDILENAKDSLSHAVSHLLEKKSLDESSYKRVILDLAHAIAQTVGKLPLMSKNRNAYFVVILKKLLNVIFVIES